VPAALTGFGAAALTVLIWSAYPVVTRAGLFQSATPQDLVFLRFGLGALLFAPFLVLRFREIPRQAWRTGIFLALCQGAGMAVFVIYGLKLAPASHAAALVPGVSPAWIALLGFLLYGRRPSARQVFAACVTVVGVTLLLSAASTRWSANVLLGDAMFLAASALGALYVLHIRNTGLGAFDAAAIVIVYSAALVMPWYLATSHRLFDNMGLPDILWQSVWQGLLIGFVSLVAMNHAIARLGAERSCAMFAFVPVLTAILAGVFLAELPSLHEAAGILAILAGVVIATVQLRAGRPATA
jgi:drug/metabolite transporter (DMT)-like permease